MKNNMMKNVLIFFGALTISSYAVAASSFHCTVREADDYSVEINLKTGKAALFDGNEWHVVRSARFGAIAFSGKDKNGKPLYVKFDDSEMGDNSFVIYFEDGEKVKSDLTCSPDKKLVSGI